MKLLLLLGNTAVGKMTVGQELCKITDLRLMHNHLTIEPVIELFGYFKGDTVKRVREVYFNDFLATKAYGLVLTFMFAFDVPREYKYINSVIEKFRSAEAEIFACELVAPQDVRLRRNVTENRLKHKASKRDIEKSNARLLADDAGARIESNDGEFEEHFPGVPYFKLDNTDISAEAAALMIKERFGL
ncbi:MAG: shikimate kinase [Oscillospiraceae bacterium]|jgi:hypothetical protein|nr:shikimate kinase [Oscillospiraceae bacterium]